MTRSRKILWALAVTVVGLVGYSALPDAGQMLSGATADENQRDVLRQQVALADAALSDEEAFLADLEEARAAVPAAPDLPAVIDVLEETVRRSGMRWTSGAPSAPDAQADATQGSWQLAMTVSGSARDLPGLLDAFRVLERLIVVDSVQVRNDGDGVVAQISVRFFALPGDPLAFASPAPVEGSAAEGS